MEHGLEVEGEEIGAGNEDAAVTETDEEGGDVGAVFEEAQWHDRVQRELPFVDEEEDDGDETEAYQADHGRGRPGVADAAVLEA